MSKLVLLWLDAFSDRYLSPEICPHIWRISRRGFFSRIRPLFSYIGIKYCFEYGVSLNTHGIWTDHIFAGFDVVDKLRNNLFKKFLNFVDKVSFSDDWNKIFRYLSFRLAGVEYGTPHLIPAHLIDVFPVPKVTFKGKSLYDILGENGVKYLRAEPKLSSSEITLIKRIPKLLKDYDALFFKFNSLDRLGHKYGPLSNAVRQRVKLFDRLVGGLVGKLGTDVVLILMSDHGMVPVIDCFDLISFLRDRGLRFGRHYMGFIGATYASFWFKNVKCRNAVRKEVSMLEIGSFLTSEDKKELRINGIGSEYGEEIFAIKEHYAFFPEFYHWRKTPKGMHGYAFSKYDAAIFLMLSDKRINVKKNMINFTDIMPTTLRLLGLPIPSDVEGKTLI